MVWLEAFFLFIWLKCIWVGVHSKQMFKPTPALFPLGIYVYGDGIIVGAWWSLLTLLTLAIGSWDWWALGACCFWLIRAGGEVIYWLIEQFAATHRNNPRDLWGYRWVKDESIWFIYQLINQCFMIFALLGIFYFVKRIYFGD